MKAKGLAHRGPVSERAELYPAGLVISRNGCADASKFSGLSVSAQIRAIVSPHFDFD
jgi:hypothetical protein